MNVYRRTWTQQEDNVIKVLIAEFGTKAWILVSQKFTSEYKLSYRSPKQCRERWHNHLDPQIVKKPWSEEEEKILIEKQKIYGNKWAKIAKFLPGKTDNCVKNHFYSFIRRKTNIQSKPKKSKRDTRQNVDIQIPVENEVKIEQEVVKQQLQEDIKTESTQNSKTVLAEISSENLQNTYQIMNQQPAEQQQILENSYKDTQNGFSAFLPYKRSQQQAPLIQQINYVPPQNIMFQSDWYNANALNYNFYQMNQVNAQDVKSELF